MLTVENFYLHVVAAHTREVVVLFTPRVHLIDHLTRAHLTVLLIQAIIA